MKLQSPDIILLLDNNDRSELILEKIYKRFQNNQIIWYNKLNDILDNLNNPSVVIFSPQLEEVGYDFDKLSNLFKKSPQSEYIGIDCPPELALVLHDEGVLSSFRDFHNHAGRIYEVIELALLKISTIPIPMDPDNFIEIGNEKIICASEKIKKIFYNAKKLADSDSAIFILGATGVGKESLAKYIHLNSKRKDKELYTSNAGSLDKENFESRLFGSKKGSFTGSIANKKGLVEIANESSLFLDEISSIDEDIQTKLLRLIQNKEYSKVNEAETLKANIRLIFGGTSYNKLRSDFKFRLHVIELPPLKDRKKEIPIFIDYFLEKFNKEKARIKVLHPDAIKYLEAQDFPGNIRQLENIISRAVSLSDPAVISEEFVKESYENKFYR